MATEAIENSVDFFLLRSFRIIFMLTVVCNVYKKVSGKYNEIIQYSEKTLGSTYYFSNFI